ncbi:ORF MSV059 hypothetical protein [Melanoplus sanguinipes entomopoxvirus]|uniref:K Homology domain-containing protein n=1 Tax=Melanoplus sanguinipes entomopoxvirus TaxID=83191 RepID=Q9YW33_MSEPV|nr:ORF MSV059 hypothetical protein [Melanoplus sanguinipes entomopoxvirus]AAC97819.1 ORF MSV059 hypothetical protein [Melanoplus sanguinipes entomopoxvirus 'O']
MEQESNNGISLIYKPYSQIIDINKETSMCIYISIYQEVIGKIIGKNGITVSNIAKDIGLNIKIDKENMCVVLRTHGLPKDCLIKLVNAYDRIENIIKMDQSERKFEKLLKK